MSGVRPDTNFKQGSTWFIIVCASLAISQEEKSPLLDQWSPDQNAKVFIPVLWRVVVRTRLKSTFAQRRSQAHSLPVPRDIGCRIRRLEVIRDLGVCEISRFECCEVVGR
jgi:hypothetical protein